MTMEPVEKLDPLAHLAQEYQVGCGELLAPIPGESWVCVLPAGHVIGDHLAEDGTCW